jgi:hypothetical protein
LPKCLIKTISPVAMIMAFVVLQGLRAQTAPPKSVDDIKIDVWNSAPVPGSAYVGVESAPAPRRDLSGIWDATGDPIGGPPPGIQPTGANEHRAVLRGNNNPPGGEPDERNIPCRTRHSAKRRSNLTSQLDWERDRFRQ